MISIGRVGKALVLSLLFSHHIHLEPDTLFKPHYPVQNFRRTFLHHFLPWKHLWEMSVKICIICVAKERRSILIMVMEL